MMQKEQQAATAAGPSQFLPSFSSTVQHLTAAEVSLYHGHSCHFVMHLLIEIINCKQTFCRLVAWHSGKTSVFS